MSTNTKSDVAENAKVPTCRACGGAGRLLAGATLGFVVTRPCPDCTRVGEDEHCAEALRLRDERIKELEGELRGLRARCPLCWAREQTGNCPDKARPCGPKCESFTDRGVDMVDHDYDCPNLRTPGTDPPDPPMPRTANPESEEFLASDSVGQRPRRARHAEPERYDAAAQPLQVILTDSDTIVVRLRQLGVDDGIVVEATRRIERATDRLVEVLRSPGAKPPRTRDSFEGDAAAVLAVLPALEEARAGLANAFYHAYLDGRGSTHPRLETMSRVANSQRMELRRLAILGARQEVGGDGPAFDAESCAEAMVDTLLRSKATTTKSGFECAMCHLDLGKCLDRGECSTSDAVHRVPRTETAVPENLASDPVARRLLVDVVAAGRELLEHGTVDEECFYAGRLEKAIAAYDEALLGRSRKTQEPNT